jgi:hypothetical protein
MLLAILSLLADIDYFVNLMLLATDAAIQSDDDDVDNEDNNDVYDDDDDNNDNTRPVLSLS